jgi:hypothetical protein
MNSTPYFNARRSSRPWAAAAGILAFMALGVMPGSNSCAQNMYQPSGLTPGGVPAQATVSLDTVTPTNATLSWYGMNGWYTVQMKTNILGPWTSVDYLATTNFSSTVTVTNTWGPSAMFQLSQANGYVGSGGCAGCHDTEYGEYLTTLHSTAYTNTTLPLSSCTVGYGQGGYTDPINTPQLENVGCENCHGPAAWHKYSDHSLILPAITIAAEVCGGCHSTAAMPTYNEWSNSPHAVLPSNFTNGASAFNNPTAGPAEMMSCGPCHSGATRLAMLQNYEQRMAGTTNYLTLPTGHDAAAYGQTCAVCHDPHNANAYQVTNITSTIVGTNTIYTTNIVASPYQLRNPLNSTNYFTFFTGTATNVVYYTNWDGTVTATTNWMNDNFADQYNPSIHMCAQCHNTRGARWDGTGIEWTGTNFITSPPNFSRGPHESPQYNILIGIVEGDYLTTNSSGVATNYASGSNHSGLPSSGTYNTNQCATCHVPIYTLGGGTNVTGHTFALQTNNCFLCHSSVPNWQGLQTNTILSLSNSVNLLNQWATQNGPALFGANYSNYLQNAWEYTSPGALATATNKGPSSSDQLLLPVAIQQARFDLYMVENDGSFGVHNPGYVVLLITDATNKVNGQLNAAYFSASPANGFAPLTVKFTPYGTGITGYSWNFGDGVGASTSPNPTYTYVNPGTNAVTLTVTNAGGTVTMTNYVYIYTPPVPAFSGSPTTGTAPLTVTFTNLTAAVPAVSAWKWTFEGGVSGGPTSSSKNPIFTYTNAGTYNVYLRATATNSPTGGTGTVTTTNLNYIIVAP